MRTHKQGPHSIVCHANWNDCTFLIVLMMKRSSCERKKTLPDFPGEGSSRRAWSPASSKQDEEGKGDKKGDIPEKKYTRRKIYKKRDVQKGRYTCHGVYHQMAGQA